MHRAIDHSKLSTALARAAIEELRPQTLPREFVHTFCARCDSNEPTTPGRATAAAAQVLYMQNLARGAEAVSALREACKVIEDSARDSFFRAGMTQQEFERVWRSEELQRWGQWTRLKTVAGLPHTEPELAGCGDD